MPRFCASAKLRAGKLVKDEQPCQQSWNVVPFEVSISGNAARLEQFRHALEKLMPAEVLISGKLVRPEQLLQVSEKFVQAAVLISGKLVRPVQLCHV